MNILMALLALGILIFIHELGHFWAARATGVRVEEFAVGFGSPLVKFRRGQTLYRLNWIPIGGYVKMLGEDNPEAASAPDNFNNRPLAARMLVIVAGVIMNFLGAIAILALLINFYGLPTDKIKNVYVAGVVSGSPAEKAGLRENDVLLTINGKKIVTQEDFTKEIQANEGKLVSLQVLRDSNTVDLQLTPVREGNKPPMVGISIGGTPVYQQFGGVVPNTIEAVKHTGFLTYLTVDGFGKLITGQFAFKDMAGPVGIIQITGKASEAGLPNYLYIMALLSVNLAVLNLVPIPGLDGGRLMFLILEGLRGGKRIPLEKEASINLIGILFLLGLMVIVTFQDVFKLISQ
ncbi:RIP metalloprotease RseP [Effusibacillus lacus]|uniref:Zinc metalloprotease n=1 Tax=Effusibacillus lacus TaxID=1348429 RepID=A0A292YJ51_9BACL|nr:RIP metalloprotease RseP [Effusibacillus lacus]TCS76793.1 regulator of sigma E protease [Effusibacillus lacus]GAX91127.1 RIP metalloprotease RseP [Effusibacillus lacus]